MKTLIMLTRPPYPATDGTRERIWQKINSLKKVTKFDVVIIGQEKISQYQKNALLAAGASCVYCFSFKPIFGAVRSASVLLGKESLQSAFFASPRAFNWFKKNHSSYQKIYFHTIRFGRYIEEVAKQQKKAKIILDFNDAISLNYQKAAKVANGWWRLAFAIESKRLLKYERKMLSLADKAIIISQRDKRHIETKGSNKIQVIKHGIEKNIFNHRYNAKYSNLSFIGNLSYPPNRQGLKKFCLKILPLILLKNPDLKLVAIGRGSESLSALKGVIGMGFVSEPYQLLGEQSIFINAADFGAGIPTKALLAMAIGLPVVSTAENVGGIDGIQEGKNIIFIDYKKPKEAAEIIISLLNNKERLAAIGAAGKKLAARYQLEESNKKFNALFTK